FRANYRTARAYEEVTVTAAELTVRKVNHRGLVRQWTLNPLWVRLERVVHDEFGIERLFLVSHGRRLAIAAFLSPPEKASFATALTGALGEAKRGPGRPASGPRSPAGRGIEISAGNGWFGALRRPRLGANDGGSHVVARSCFQFDAAVGGRRRLRDRAESHRTYSRPLA